MNKNDNFTENNEENDKKFFSKQNEENFSLQSLPSRRVQILSSRNVSTEEKPRTIRNVSTSSSQLQTSNVFL